MLAALRRRLPGLRLTVRTTLARPVVLARVAPPVEVRPGVPDVGMVMRSGLQVALEESAQAYARLHARWPVLVERSARELRRLAPDLVLADVPHLSLAGAARAGVPAVALCSLNWADVYGHYLGTTPGAQRVLAEMRAAYRSCVTFLQPRPHMPMPGLGPTRSIGPVAARGRRRRQELDRRLRLEPRERLVVVGLGGFPTRLPTAGWPRIPGVRWALPADWGFTRPDVVTLEAAQMPFLDLLAGGDLLVTKTGYGSFVEAACSGLPLAYVRRPDWPEEPYLVRWLEAHGCCRALDPGTVDGADWVEALGALLAAPRPAPVEPTGNAEAAGLLAEMLGAG